MDYLTHLTVFNKSYSSQDEFQMRLQRFEEVDAFIKETNANPENKHTAGHNQFSDWTYAEYTAMLGYKSRGERRNV